MIPKFRMWNRITSKLHCVYGLYFDSKEVQYTDEVGILRFIKFENTILMQSTGLKDKNGKEIFEGDILKFNDEWDDYCYEGCVDGSTEGINFVEIKRETTCFTFGKFQTSDSSLLYFMKDEYLSFEDLITDKDFEFEIVGNIYENPELLEDNS